jgi:hypothetical protein
MFHHARIQRPHLLTHERAGESYSSQSRPASLDASRISRVAVYKGHRDSPQAGLAPGPPMGSTPHLLDFPSDESGNSLHSPPGAHRRGFLGKSQWVRSSRDPPAAQHSARGACSPARPSGGPWRLNPSRPDRDETLVAPPPPVAAGGTIPVRGGSRRRRTTPVGGAPPAPCLRGLV